MKKLVQFIMLSAIVTSCGMLKTRNVNTAEVDTVQRAAIASFSLVHPNTSSVSYNLGSGKLGVEEDRDLIMKYDPNITKTYLSLKKYFEKNAKWKIIELDEMTTNSSYQKSYADKMNGLQFGKVAEGGIHYGVKKVMDAQSLRRMEQKDKDALMEGLGVDAIIEAKVYIRHIKGHPQATLHFTAYKKGVEVPVWFEGAINGNTLSASLGESQLYDLDESLRLSHQAALLSFEKINPKL